MLRPDGRLPPLDLLARELRRAVRMADETALPDPCGMNRHSRHSVRVRGGTARPREVSLEERREFRDVVPLGRVRFGRETMGARFQLWIELLEQMRNPGRGDRLTTLKLWPRPILALHKLFHDRRRADF